MTENYWTTGADDDQSRCTITQDCITVHGKMYDFKYSCAPNNVTVGRDKLMTVVHPNGQPVQGGDIAAGQEVTVQLNCENKTAVLLHGDFITIEANYERRTFWQWLRNKPRRLKLYKAQNNTCQVEK